MQTCSVTESHHVFKSAYLTATAAAEAGLPGGGMALRTVAVICGVGIVGSCTGGGAASAETNADDSDDDVDDAAGERGGAGDDWAGGVAAAEATSGGVSSAEGGGGGGESDMTSSMMVAGVDATDPSSSRMWSSITGSSITAATRGAMR